ncbi:hypothetical protein S7711_05343 [Stachybotrys chartarum IBT 7711]|uniref:RNA polymerase II degradation factor 1 n=1 Tax=Stachybotrys chartarum (strain CBS 109288 / IBT 7711) TaxID=1280523 RepID=A0A084B962_STACB|nr:hypothetical protein S7711_05343 [Stachybotrys chartarum IBT 7711]
MSEVSSRPSASRGRGSGRGGRGGFAGRGGRRTNGDKADQRPSDDVPSAFDDAGDFAELRKQYGGKTSVIREMFPDWSEVDILFALEETKGDENEAVARIAEGMRKLSSTMAPSLSEYNSASLVGRSTKAVGSTISQWGEVSKPKKTPRPKTKDAAAAPVSSEGSSAAGRPARGRVVSEGGRGRGRASDRGGRGGRGRSANPTPGGPQRNKENSQLSVPTEESPAWNGEQTKVESQDVKPTPVEETATVEPPKSAASTAKTWASMLRQATVPKVAPKPKEAPAAPPPAPTESVETQPPAEAVEAVPEPAEPEQDATTPVAQQAEVAEQPTIVEPEIALPPSKDELTETNLEQVVDESQPPATGTAASTAADSWDPRQNPPSGTATPISAAQQQHQTQRTVPPPATPGFPASAIKATTGRLPSYQRRVLDQEEAVRMPSNREVDRTAVQFGAFNLNEGEDDIDGDREEPETRAQPPGDSPIAHPRASLPPVSQPSTVPESLAQKPAAAAPSEPAPAAAAAPQAPTPSQPAPPAGPGAHQLGRYGQVGPQDAQQKPLDPFTQQPTPSSQLPFDNYSGQTSQAQAQQPAGGFTSGPNDYSSYYSASQQDRNAYGYYGQQFGQQHGAQGQQQEGLGSQRGFGGYNASQTDSLSQYPQSGSHHSQPRFGGAANDAQNSGHSTPNPTAQGQQAQQQPQGPGQQQGSQQPQGAPGSQPQSHGQQYPYSHPYYSNPYYHQYYSNYNQAGFSPYGKGGMYGQPYGVSPNAPYDHASSPASFGQSTLHRDSGLGSGLGEYGRAGSTQGSNQPGLGGNSFGSVHDSFARGASSFQSQGGSYNSPGQPAAGPSGDELKPFGDAKSAAGPSPSLGGARPGSAANNAPAGQSGLPPPQGSQMGGAYGGYPSHLQGHGIHGSSGYGMGGGAGSAQHGNSPYGSYSQGFGSGGYYGNQQQQQQQQQQRGGWGGNYH